jgi:hypothetical protein
MDDPLRDIMTSIGDNATPTKLGQAASQYSEPAIQQVQQLIQMLFGPKQDPNANMIWDEEMQAPRPKGSRLPKPPARPGGIKQQLIAPTPPIGQQIGGISGVPGGFGFDRGIMGNAHATPVAGAPEGLAERLDAIRAMLPTQGGISSGVRSPRSGAFGFGPQGR